MDTTTLLTDAIETLEALYFLLKHLEHNRERLYWIRANYCILESDDREILLNELINEIKDVKDKFGAFANDDVYPRLLRDARQAQGMSYLSKLYIDSALFSHYDEVFPRWPHVKPHALVVFDGHSMSDLRNILEVEGMLYDDVKLLLDHAREAHKQIENFRQRSPRDQAKLQSYLRAAATGIYRFLESYLNGLAYDSFQLHHDQLTPDEHDLLGEWDSKNKVVRYTSLRTKLFRYPVIVGKLEGLELDLSECELVKILAGYGKDVRNALTHPSDYIDPTKGLQEKLLFVTGVNLPLVEELFVASQEYVKFVEISLNREAEQSVRWLFSDH